MTQQILQDVSSSNLPQFASLDLEVGEMKPGLLFPDEETATASILKWGEKALCPLSKARREKGLAETNGAKIGRRCLDCPHGRKKQVKNNLLGQRPNQNIKHTKVKYLKHFTKKNSV